MEKKKYRKHNKENACAVINKKNIAKRPAIAEEKREPDIGKLIPSLA